MRKRASLTRLSGTDNNRIIFIFGKTSNRRALAESPVVLHVTDAAILPRYAPFSTFALPTR